MEPFVESREEHVLRLAEWEEAFPGLAAGFTLRTGGESGSPYASLNLGLHVGDDPARVTANRRLLARRLGVPFDAWTCADQVHGVRVVRVTPDLRGAGRERQEDAIPAADGLFTDESNILLTSFYADCVPLLFLDPDRRAVGVAHAGWKGTVGRIAEEMVRAFGDAFGTEPARLRVAMGPAIGGCCYEVDERIISRVREAAAEWRRAVVEKPNGRWQLDLRTLNRLILQEAGVAEEHIACSSWCTCCRTDLFFSHRGEGGRTGRMASFIGWRKEEETR